MLRHRRRQGGGDPTGSRGRRAGRRLRPVRQVHGDMRLRPQLPPVELMGWDRLRGMCVCGARAGVMCVRARDEMDSCRI
jgi:hypothetical protein